MTSILDKLEKLNLQYIGDREKLLFEELENFKTEKLYSDVFIEIIKHMDLNNEKTVRKIIKILADKVGPSGFGLLECEVIKILNYDELGVKFLIRNIGELPIFYGR